MGTRSLATILEHHQGKDPHQPRQRSLSADPAGMAKAVHVVGVPYPIRILPREAPRGVVDLILSMGEASRGALILAFRQILN